MREEEINAIFDSIPKVESNNCINAYGSIDMEDIKSAIKRLNKVPDYNDLLKENKELKEKNNELEKYGFYKYEHHLLTMSEQARLKAINFLKTINSDYDTLYSQDIDLVVNHLLKILTLEEDK